MAQQPPTATMSCARCGQLFTGNPRSQPLGRDNYCSISCEEGRSPRAMSDPQSPDYHLYLKGDPEALVGKTLLASGLKHVDYSADWCKGPDEWSHGTIVDVDAPNLTYVRKDDVVLGTVVDYDGHYTVEHEDMETGEITRRRIKDMLLVDQLRRDRWWVDG